MTGPDYDCARAGEPTAARHAEADMVTRGSSSSGETGVRLFHLCNEPIDGGNELFPIRERAVEHKLLRMRREQLLTRDPRPASDVAVAEKGEAADIF